ncbi:hypothetical protein E2C01_004655 [Portunus trituberculatus]|uniref:Uncharacterized protein n=1 Tax=Portunus trituberculatus TaxID=210409 RepID=A0A5B7CQ85_PORTR|nr:hypothetical protein [Portunus trituberculatus]
MKSDNYTDMFRENLVSLHQDLETGSKLLKCSTTLTSHRHLAGEATYPHISSSHALNNSISSGDKIPQHYSLIHLSLWKDTSQRQQQG